MKKQVMMVIAAVSFLSVADSSAVCKVEMKKVDRRQRLVTSYIAALAISGGVGAVTGGVLRYLENQLNMPENSPLRLFVMLLGWAVESELRNDIIGALQRDLDQYGIDHKKALMFKGAWIASWLSYLQA
jgi:hypothetical protein